MPDDRVAEQMKTALSASGELQPPSAATRTPRNALGEDRPAFLLAFPDDPELERLIQAFEAGDFRTVRARAERLARESADARVREAALELRRRTDPDPLLIALLCVCFGLLFFSIGWVYFHPS